jgi:hypothetical protein
MISKSKNFIIQKMSNLGPPIYDFDMLKPVTMTVIASYDVEELNLPAIFTFLSVTNAQLSAHLNFQKKQGKIRLPSELNVPGQIFSMRYNKQVRGIMRSEKAKSFSHSIIIDMGTSERIISVKLSRKLEFTGPTSIEIAREAAESLLTQIANCQKDLEFLQENQSRCSALKDLFVQNNELQTNDPTDKRIWKIFQEKSRGYPPESLEMFLDFMIQFNRPLYTGSLKLNQFECEMANILFNLGYPINQLAFVKVMNDEPFRCTFNNYKTASSVAVYYDYIKYDRSTGQPKQAKHTIRVNRSGHVRHSGPNLEMMKAVYYAFMKRVIANYDEIQSVENKKKQIRVDLPGRSLSIKEWRAVLHEEENLRQKVLTGQVPIATGENLEISSKEEKVTTPTDDLYLNDNGNTPMLNDIYEVETQPMSEDSFNFDYAPIALK